MNRVARLNVHLTGAALSRSIHSTTPKQIKSVTIYGSGLMGAGIVQIAASSMYNVTMVDTNDAALQRGKQTILSSLTRIAKKRYEADVTAQKSYIDNIMSRVQLTTDASNAASHADLIVEAIVENLEIKKALFSTIAKVAPSHCIMTSNTSSLKVTDIATSCPERKNYFAGLHFFNPVPQMKLVEVISTSETDPKTIQKLVEFCKSVGKSPVMCKDTPGFIVNRLLVPYMMEALRMAEKGDATTADIDTAMKLGAGYPMGPFELMDYVGLDTIKFITDGWFKSGDGLKGNELVAPSKMLNALVEKGEFGRKTGKGFYSYEKEQVKR